MSSFLTRQARIEDYTPPQPTLTEIKVQLRDSPKVKMPKGSCVCGDWTYEYEGEPAGVASKLHLPLSRSSRILTVPSLPLYSL